MGVVPAPRRRRLVLRRYSRRRGRAGDGAPRTNPAEIARLLGLARVGVPLVGVGMALVLGSGVWLVDLGNWGWDGWIVAALGLLGASAAIGTAAGQWPKRARRLAGKPADDELDRLLSHRLSLALNYASGRSDS